MHEQRFAPRARGQASQLQRAQSVGVINRAEGESRIRVQCLLECHALAGRRDHQHLHRARFARQRAQRDEVLHQALGLRSHEAGERRGRELAHALQAREAQPAVLDVALAQARPVGAHEQHARIARTERAGERRGDERRGIHAGEARAGLFEGIEPL